MCRRLTEILVLLALIAPFARAQEASSPDGRVAAYLERLALDDLLGAQLRERLSRAGDEERSQIAERLARLYTVQLTAATNERRRAQIGARSRALLDAIPDGQLFDLRVSLAIQLYLPAEEIAERARLSLATEEEKAGAIETLLDVRDSLTVVAETSDREVAVLERRERSASDSVRREAREDLGVARRIRSRSRYYAAWSGYYAALLGGAEDDAARAVRDFGFLLDSSEQRPTIDRLPKRLLRMEHVARSAIGVALCFSLEQRHTDAVRWIDELARAPEFAPEAIGQLRSATMVVLAGASEWGELSDMVARRRRAGAQVVALSEGEARLVAVLTLDALREGGLARTERTYAEALARVAVGDLSASGSVAHVLDLATRYEDLPIGDQGFIFRYAMGLRRYAEAREHHGSIGQDDSRPTEDQATVRLYTDVSESFTRALESSDAGRYPAQRDECRLRLGLSLFYGGELVMASEKLARASESEIESVRDEAEWMRVVALDTGVEGGDESLREARDEAAGEYLRLHPRSSRAVLLVMRLAEVELVGDAQAAEILASVPPEAPYADAARRHLSRLLYRLYRASPGNRKSEAGSEFLAVALPLIDADVPVALGSAEPVGEQAAQALLVRVRQVLDVVLGVDSLDVRHAERAVSVLERVTSARSMDLSWLDDELGYRRLQIALRQDDGSEAERLLAELHMDDGHFARAADRLMYRRAVVAWAAPPRKSEEARELVRHGSRVAEVLSLEDPEIAQPASLSVLNSVASAAAFLATSEADAGMRELALSLDQRVLDAGRQSAGVLRRVAQLGELGGEVERALEAWLLLLSGTDESAVTWYEARHHSIRLMLLLDPSRARQAIDQYRVLHPGTAPPPWDERMRELEAQIRLAPGGGG